jgi:hypothetical protein
MAKRKLKKSSLPPPTPLVGATAGDRENSKFFDEAANPAEPHTQPKPSPWMLAREMVQKERDADKAEEQLANSTMTLEFGNSVVVVYDGMQRMIARIPLNPSWADAVGKIQAARGCLDYACHIGNHAHFTMFEARKAKDELTERFACKPMTFTRRDER